jgi:hypothetical protein
VAQPILPSIAKPHTVLVDLAAAGELSRYNIGHEGMYPEMSEEPSTSGAQSPQEDIIDVLIRGLQTANTAVVDR